jgi:hypothetical protein
MCAGNVKVTALDFITRSCVVHNNKFTYENISIGKPLNTKVLITCPKHGIFTQKVQHHLQGSECQECANLKRLKPYLDKPTTLYFLHFSEHNIFKIGITTKTIKKRYADKNTPKYKILWEKNYTTGYPAYLEEQKLLSTYKQYVCIGESILKHGSTELLTCSLPIPS